MRNNSDLTPIRHVLNNRLALIVAENHANSTLELHGRIKLAGAGESPEKSGVTVFTSRMLQRGTTNRTSLQIASEVESLGAQLWMSGGIDSASFGMSCLSRDFEAILSVLADVLLNPTFPEVEVEKLRTELKSRLKEEKDDPASMARREFFKMIYPEGHPYRNTMGVDDESVNKIKRADLVEFHGKYYRPEVTIITVVGDINANDAISKIEGVLGKWHPQKDSLNLNYEISELRLQPAIWKKTIAIPDRSQVEVVIGHKGIRRRDPDFYGLTLMNEILSGFGGRLFTNIRDNQGLVYGVGSSFSPTLGEGPFIVRLGTNPKNVEKAVKSVLEELKRIQNEPVLDSELDDAKSSIIGRSALSMETNSGIAGMLLSSEFYGLGLDYIYKYPEFYKPISKEEVRKAAEKHIHTDKYSLVIAGPL